MVITTIELLAWSGVSAAGQAGDVSSESEAGCGTLRFRQGIHDLLYSSEVLLAAAVEVLQTDTSKGERILLET